MIHEAKKGPLLRELPPPSSSSSPSSPGLILLLLLPPPATGTHTAGDAADAADATAATATARSNPAADDAADDAAVATATAAQLLPSSPSCFYHPPHSSSHPSSLPPTRTPPVIGYNTAEDAAEQSCVNIRCSADVGTHTEHELATVVLCGYT